MLRRGRTRSGALGPHDHPGEREEVGKGCYHEASGRPGGGPERRPVRAETRCRRYHGAKGIKACPPGKHRVWRPEQSPTRGARRKGRSGSGAGNPGPSPAQRASQEPQGDNTLYASETQRHPPGCDPESRTTSLHPQAHSQGQGLPPPSLIQASGRRPHETQGSRRSPPGKGSVLVIRGSQFWEKTAPELSFSPTGTVNDPKRLQG